MDENTSTVRRHIAFLCAVFMVLTWIILLVLFLLRIGGIEGSTNLPVDYVLNMTSNSSSIVYI